MELNADFSQNVTIRPDDNTWVASPMAGVDRMMLDRIGAEVARATSLVRYAPGSAFSAHTHGGGEEFVVLDGVFSDEHGDFREGAYIRNPPTSSHTPGSAPGCVIFVKLWQMHPDDRTHVRIATDKQGAVRDSERPGVAVSPLYTDAQEDVRMETWAAGTTAIIAAPGGAEILVIAGEVSAGDDTLPKWSWMRRANGADVTLTAGAAGAKLWIKTNHLRHVTAPPS